MIICDESFQNCHPLLCCPRLFMKNNWQNKGEPWGWKGHKHLAQFLLIYGKKVKKEFYHFQLLHLMLFLKGNYSLFSFAFFFRGIFLFKKDLYC